MKLPYENFTQAEVEALTKLIPRIRCLPGGDLVTGCQAVMDWIDWEEEMSRQEAEYLAKSYELAAGSKDEDDIPF